MKLEMINAVTSLISLMGLWWLLFWLYHDYCVDKFRQEIFALRDALFDSAADGSIPFDHPGYGLLRSTMNGFIRFAHKLTLLDILMLVFVHSSVRRGIPSEQSFSRRFDAAIANLPEETKSQLISCQVRMNTLLVKHVARNSPVLILTVIVPILSWVAVRFCLRQVMAALRTQIDRIDATAFAVGQ